MSADLQAWLGSFLGAHGGVAVAYREEKEFADSRIAALSSAAAALP